MNYEEKYKKGISFLKDLKPHMSDYCKEKLEGFFPELRESEDERIRKEITEYITRYKDCITDKEYNSWISWLEKQGEKSWSEEEEEMIDFMIEFIESLYWRKDLTKRKDEVLCWLKSLKNRVQPKQEWSEGDEKMLDSIIDCIDGTGLLDFDQIDWLKSLKPQNRWKPSEEQMQALFEAKLASTKNREYFLGLLYEDLTRL